MERKIGGGTYIRYTNEIHIIINEDFPFIYENKIMIYGHIKAETTSDVDYVRFSVVRPKVKVTLHVYQWMHAGMCASLLIP